MFSCSTKPICRRKVQGAWIDHYQVDAIDQHPAEFGHMQPLQKLGDRVLAWSRRADLARLNLGRNVTQDFTFVRPVAKRRPRAVEIHHREKHEEEEHVEQDGQRRAGQPPFIAELIATPTALEAARNGSICR